MEAKRMSASERETMLRVVTAMNNVINALLEGCKEQCIMCNLDKGQRRACALKKALDAVPNDIPDKMDGDCPYFGQF